jgi:predicted ester cyclase
MSTPRQSDLATPDADITRVVRAFYEPFRTGDTTIYSEILDASWLDIPLAPGQEHGAAGMAAQIAMFRHAMPDYAVMHEDILVGGDRVAVRNTVTGTHLGAFMGHLPTGRRIEMRTMDMHQVRDGRILATWHLEDIAGLVAQLSASAGTPVRAAWS